MTAQNESAAPLSVSVGVQCHPGKSRTDNQDRISRADTPFGDLYVIADGVGGYEGGGDAAQATVDGFARELQASAGWSLESALQTAAEKINRELEERGSRSDPPSRMSSTVVLAVVRDGIATVGHVGDSRAYLVRAGKLRQVTRDHSVMQRLIDQGVVDAVHARDHPSASVLTQALGQPAVVSMNIERLPLLPGDEILLCSDGLWGYVQDTDIEAVLNSSNLSAAACADALLDLALEGGGGDNISVQVLRFAPVERVAAQRSLFGMPPNIAFIGISLVAAMVLAAAGLTIWNHFHSPGKDAIDGVLVVTAASSSSGGRAPSEIPSSLPRSPRARSQCVIIRDRGRQAPWAGRLPDLPYLETHVESGSAACLVLQRDRSTLYYRPKSRATAIQVERDLGLNAVEMAGLEDGNRDCGDADLLAMPSQSSSGTDLERVIKKKLPSIPLPGIGP